MRNLGLAIYFAIMALHVTALILAKTRGKFIASLEEINTLSKFLTANMVGYTLLFICFNY